MKTYIIDYRVFTQSRGTYHPPKMKVKNCYTELEAKIKLERMIETKYTGYLRMEVIDCKEDFIGGDLFSNVFGNAFKKR